MFAPFGNTTVLPPAEWHPELQFRGTYSILSSCLITMSLCIWTSLHLNLPAHKKEHLQKYRKLGWMILGLLAPELVVWNAWEQRKRAKKISRLMKEKRFMPAEIKTWRRISEWLSRALHHINVILLREPEDLPEFKEVLPTVLHNGHVHAWTDVHSWLVVMGGIAFEDSDPGTARFMPGGRERLVVHPDMFTWIVEEQPHLIPDISISEIEDKSKTDRLAKILTFGQTSYFCIQCIFRLSQSFSITLLELNVFAHALCALLLFLIWWDKPRDIYKPVAITGEEALDICACLLKKRPDRNRYSYSDTIKNPPFEVLVSQEVFEITHPRHINLLRMAVDHEKWEYAAVLGTYVYSSIKISDSHWNVNLLIDEYLGTLFSDLFGLYATIDVCDFERLKRVSRIASRSTQIIASIRYDDVKFRLPDRTSNLNLSLTGTIVDLMDLHYLDTDLWLLCGLTFAGACYGGLHITAWANQFPSYAETVLWRAATITILVTGPSCALVGLCATALYKSRVLISSRVGDPIAWFSFSVLFLCLLLLWYILCRAFIVVECFILMAHIPTSALGVPTWAAYIPHIS